MIRPQNVRKRFQKAVNASSFFLCSLLIVGGCFFSLGKKSI